MTYLLSLQCFLSALTRWFFFLTLDEAVDLALQAGYDGIEYFPFRWNMTHDVLNGNVNRTSLSRILSAHQAWRSERNIFEIWSPLAAKAFFLVPERRNSMRHLLMLQELTGRNIPVTLYPYHEGIIGGKEWNEGQYPEFSQFLERWVQTDTGLLTRWKVNSPIGFVNRAAKRGFTGIVIDTAHIRKESDGLSFGDWRQSIPTLLPHTKAIHVRSISPQEKEGAKYNNQVEMYNFVRNQSGELHEMLRQIRDQNWQGLVVTETPFDTIRWISPGIGHVSKQEFVKAHKRLLGSIKGVLQVPYA